MLSLVISSLSSGGAERVMSLLANRWADRGQRICLVTIDSTATDCYPLDPRIRRIALDLMAESPGFFAALANNYRRIRALRRALEAVGTTVVVSFGEQMNMLVLLAVPSRSIRKIISERTDPARHRIGRIWELLRRLTYPLAQALVVQTRGLLPWAEAAVGKRRAYVIPNPVRPLERSANARPREHSRIILAVGRLVPAKGFDVLANAFAEIAHEFPESRLVITGEGPERQSLSALSQKLQLVDRVSFPGWVAEPAELMATATIFVLPSRYEGFPNALIEAMACGLPVISTACAGPLEIVENEVDGLLVPVDSVSELANAMRRLLQDEDLRSLLRRNAMTVSTRYSLDAIVPMWDAVIANHAPAGASVSGTEAATQR
jgi:glycosyltransferase involved in cell wall biosynthesis